MDKLIAISLNFHINRVGTVMFFGISLLTEIEQGSYLAHGNHSPNAEDLIFKARELA